MARQLVVLALLFVAISAATAEITSKSPEIVALVESLAPNGFKDEASSPASAPVSSGPVSSATASGPDSAIGPIDDSSSSNSGVAEEAPVGGPVSDDAFSNATPVATADAPTVSTNGATTLEVSAIAGVAAVAGFFF